ncbi:Scr1 family TA system antitoxin-like transcriptional regulator [Actinomadura sp. 1N219]|uniref:helix-turn-helix domain-containing protein n=1 Tax=Actinomadura sp. 1N219 TaxID=3375152 RepID=UPI00379A273F
MPVPENPHESAAAKFSYRLRKLRVDRGMSAKDVAAACYVSRETISAIETRQLPPRLATAQFLDELFDLTELAYFEDAYHDIVREATWSPFRLYKAQEALARSIRSYDPLHIYGVFQTVAYARELLSSYEPPHKVDEYVAMRMSRQEILARDHPPQIVAVIRESVLRETVGGSQVMQEQLARLLEISELPCVGIHVVPTGGRVFPLGMFRLLTYDVDADLGYVETAIGGHVVEPPEQVNLLSMWFDRILGDALPADASGELIRTIMESM